jgi:hypothetical protein
MLVPLELTLTPVAATPPNDTEIAAAMAPKLRPESVTAVPTLPAVGDIPHTTGSPEFVTARVDEELWLSEPLAAVTAAVPAGVQAIVVTVTVACCA